MPALLIETKKLTYVYPGQPESAPALKEINLKIYEGEYIALIGANVGQDYPAEAAKRSAATHFRRGVYWTTYPPAMKEPFSQIRSLCGMIFRTRTTRLSGPRWKKTLPSA